MEKAGISAKKRRCDPRWPTQKNRRIVLGLRPGPERDDFRTGIGTRAVRVDSGKKMSSETTRWQSKELRGSSSLGEKGVSLGRKTPGCKTPSTEKGDSAYQKKRILARKKRKRRKRAYRCEQNISSFHHRRGESCSLGPSKKESDQKNAREQ